MKWTFWNIQYKIIYFLPLHTARPWACQGSSKSLQVVREQISWVCPNGKSMQVLLLEVDIQKPTFKVFLMTQSLDGKANLGFLIDLLWSSTLWWTWLCPSYPTSTNISKKIIEKPVKLPARPSLWRSGPSTILSRWFLSTVVMYRNCVLTPRAFNSATPSL